MVFVNIGMQMCSSDSVITQPSEIPSSCTHNVEFSSDQDVVLMCLSNIDTTLCLAETSCHWN